MSTDGRSQKQEEERGRREREARERPRRRAGEAAAFLLRLAFPDLPACFQLKVRALMSEFSNLKSELEREEVRTAFTHQRRRRR